jgi:hypothetical protein
MEAAEAALETQFKSEGLLAKSDGSEETER